MRRFDSGPRLHPPTLSQRESYGEVPRRLVSPFTNNPEIARRIFGLRIGEICEGAVGDIAIFDYDPPTPGVVSANIVD